MNRSALGDSSTRPKIFEQWPPRREINNFNLEDRSDTHRKPRQSLRAQQALEKSLFFIQNIKTYEKQFTTYKEKIKEFNQQAQTHEQELENLIQQNGKKFQKKQFIENLRRYFLKIKDGGKLLRELRGFGLANLQNYDPTTTKMECTRTLEQADQILKEKLAQLNRKRCRVQQSLVKYQYYLQESIILGQQNSFQICLGELLKSMEPEQISQFHFLMLYKLRELDEVTQALQQKLLACNENYSRYEGFNDSYNLMQNQIQQMMTDRKHLKRKFKDLDVSNAGQIIPKTTSSLPILQRNVKIYESNLDLFARHNAETNLRDYGTKRNNFISEFATFKTLFDNWKKQQKHAQYLYSRHEVLIEHNKKVDIGQKKGGDIEWEFKKMQRAYLEVMQHKIPPKMTNIERYKQGVASQFEKVFKQKRIAFPKRAALLSSPINNKSNKLQPYISFFMTIKNLSYKQKVSYISSQSDQIQSLSYSLQKICERKDLEEQKYQIGLQYANNIAKYLTEHKSQRQYLSTAENLSEKRWQALPIGFQTVVFHFTRDIYIKKEALSYLQNSYKKHLNKYAQIMNEEILRITNWQKFVETSQIPFSANDIDLELRREFFIKFVYKISKYSPMIRDELVQIFLQKHQAVIEKSYQRVIDSIQKLEKIDKKHFFTFKILCYLAHTDRKIKVPNIKELIIHYLGLVDRYDNMRWVPQHFFAQIIKQRILLKYLQNYLSKYMNVKAQIQSIKRINKWCIFRYLVNDHLSLVQSDSQKDHFLHSLQLLRNMQEQKQFRYQIIDDEAISNKTANVCQNLEKNPLIIGKKHSVDNYESLINYSISLEKLEEMGQIKMSKRMQFLSNVYSQCEKLKDVTEIINSIQFQSSDVLAVKQNPKKLYYMDQVRQKVQQDLTKPLIDTIKAIINLYQGEDDQSKPPKTQLSKILEKLRLMAKFN